MNNEQKHALEQAPPRDELKTRRQGQATLTYIEGRYTIEAMNRIFGPDGWSRQFAGNGLTTISKTEGVPKDKQQTRYDVGMLCEYRVTVGSVVIEDVGYGIGQSYQGYADAYESAAKEAVTDAMKRCCRSLGNALGNCLYDKDWLSGKKAVGDEANGEVGKDDDEEARAKADQEAVEQLLRNIGRKLKAVEAGISPKDFLRVVSADCLGRQCATEGDAKQITAALKARMYAWETGERIPPPDGEQAA